MMATTTRANPKANKMMRANKVNRLHYNYKHIEHAERKRLRARNDAKSERWLRGLSLMRDAENEFWARTEHVYYTVPSFVETPRYGTFDNPLCGDLSYDGEYNFDYDFDSDTLVSCLELIGDGYHFGAGFNNDQVLEYQSGIDTNPVITTDGEVIAKDLVSTTVPTFNLDYNITSAVEDISQGSIFDRPYLYPLTFSWSTSDTRFSLLSSLELPNAFFSLEGIAPFGALSYHALYKSSFNITIKTDATNYNQGIVVAFAVPGVATKYDTFTNLNYATIMNYPHAFLNVGLENEVSFMAPYSNIFSAISPAERNLQTSNNIYFMVWSPLKAGVSAPTNLTFSIWLQPIDTHLSVKTTALVPQASIIKPIAHLILDNFSIPYADKLKSVGKIFGMYDRVPRDDLHPESAISGDVGITVINTKINQLEVIPKMTSRFNQSDFTDFMHFARIPSLANAVDWTTSQTNGTIIDQMIISATSPMIYAGSKQVVDTWYATNISGVASLFTLYRGSIEVEIVVVASSFHRGTLLFAFDPYGTPNTSVDKIYGLPSVSLSIGSNDNTIRIRLPYNKHKDYVKNMYPEPDIANEIGHLYVVVQNALKAPVGVSTSIEILFYVNAGEDGEFKYPIRPSKRTVLQQADLVYQSLSFYSNDHVEPGFIIGDHSNILTYMRRINYVKLIETAITAGPQANSRNIYGTRLPEGGFHGIVKQLFKYNSGGVTIHFITNVGATETAVRYFRFDNGPKEHPFATSQDTQKLIDVENVWMGAATQVNKMPAQNYLMPGYNDIPFFYNSEPITEIGWTEQNWKTSLNYETFFAHNLQETVGHSVADDFNFYIPMSMFKLGSPVAAMLPGSVFPKMTSTTVNGFVLSSTNVNGPLKAFDQNLATVAKPQTTANTVEFAMFLPTTFKKTLTKIYLSMQYNDEQDLNTTVSVIGFTNPTYTTLRTFNNLNTAVGYNEIPNDNVYDSYIFRFVKTNANWNLFFNEIQAYTLPGVAIYPTMYANDIPLGYSVENTADNVGLYKIRSDNDDTWTSATPTVNNNVKIVGPAAYRAVAFYLDSLTGATTGWTIVGYKGINSTTLYTGTTDMANLKINANLGAVDNYDAYGINVPGCPFLQIRELQFYAEGIVPQCGLDARKKGDRRRLDEQIKQIEEFGQIFLDGQLEAQGFEFSAITSGMDTMRNFFRQVKDAIKSFDTIGKLANKVNSSIDNIKKIFNKLMNIVLGVVNIVNGLYVVMNSDQTGLIANGVAGMVGAVYNITCSVELNEELHAQTATGFTAFVDRIRERSQEAANIAARWLDVDKLLSVFKQFFAKFGIKTDITEIYARESHDYPDRGAVGNVLHSVLAFFLYGKDYLQKVDAKFNREITSFKERLIKFRKSITLGATYDHDGEKLTCVEKYKKFQAEYDTFLRRSASVSKRTDTNIRAIEVEMKDVERAVHKMTLIKPHIEPVSIFICGGSGVGKTIMAGHIIPLIINNRLKDDKNFRHVDFSKVPYLEAYPDLTHIVINSEHLKYDSLYRHQPIMIVDDAFTERNGLDSAFLTRVVNSASLEVAKADVSDKGEIYDSQIIIITCNETDPVSKASEFINSAGKITRRLGQMYQLTLRKGQTTMNVAELPELTTLNMDDRERAIIALVNQKYIFTPYEYTKNSNVPVAGSPVTFERVINDLQAEFVRKTQFMDTKFNYLAGLEAQSGVAEEFHECIDIEDSSEDDIDVGDVLDTLTFVPFTEECRDTYAKEIDFIIKNSSTVGVAARLAEFGSNKIVDVKWKIIFDLVKVPETKWKAWKGFDFEICKAFQSYTGMSLTTCGLIGIAIGTVLAGIKSIINYIGKNVGMAFQNLIYEGVKTHNVKHIVNNRLIPQVGKPVYNEHELNEINAVRKQVHKIAHYVGSEKRNESHCFFVNSRTIITNKHFFRAGKDFPYSHIRIQQKTKLGDTVSFEAVAISPDQIYDYGENSDLVMCKLPVYWPNVRTYKNFVTKTVTDKRAIFIGATVEEDVSVQWKGDVANRRMYDDNIEVSWVGYPEGFQSQFGDCGRPYYVFGSGGSTSGVVGIHSALERSSGLGAASLIKDLTIENTPEEAYEFEASVVQSKFWTSKIPLMAQTKIDGIDQTRFVCRRSKYERIEPSLVEESECDAKPAAMNVKMVGDQLYDPLIGGSQKWDTDKWAGVPMRYIQLFTDYFMNKLPEVQPRVLTEHEMINGIGNMGRLKMTTSPGYYARWFNDGKREIFTALPQQYDDKGQALPLEYEFSEKAKITIIEHGLTFPEILKKKEDMMKQLKLPSFPFICTLKDELRPKAKVEIGKTRVFEQSSLDFVMLCRKYMGHFIDMYRTHAGFTLYHGIGREPESVWHKYAHTLFSNSTYGHAFDYKNFDGSLPKECFTFFHNIIKEYYKDAPQEDNNVRECLCVSMQNAVHIMGGFSFESTQGNKSGNAFTDVFNSIANTFLIWVTFISWQIVVRGQQANLSAFDSGIKMLTYGDDVVMSIRKRFLDDGYDGKHIQQCLEALGVTITSANKTSEIEKYITFDEMTYLKRPFVWDEEYRFWRSPLPVSDILKELKYRPKTAKNNINDLHDRLENAQRYLVGHPKDCFRKVCKNLRQRSKQHDLPEGGTFGVSYDALSADIRLKQQVCEPLY